MEENKNELLVFICMILAIGLFILFMPDIERLLFGQAKKEKEEQKTEQKEEKKNDYTNPEVTYTGKFTCGITGTENETIKYIINYEDSKVISIKEESSTIYTAKDNTFNKAETECNSISERYKNQTGFTASCEVSDLTITKTYNYDLKLFNDFVVTYKVDNKDIEETVTVPNNVKYGDDYKAVAELFKENGASCK